MASTRSSQKRNVRLAPLTSQTKPGISVEEWEAKALIDDKAIHSVNAIKQASDKISLPDKSFPTGTPTTSRPTTPATRQKVGYSSLSSRPTTPISSTIQRSFGTHALHPKHPIQTPQQFYDWFSLIDNSVTHQQESQYREHLESVSAHLETCERLVQRVDDIDRDVADMLDDWRSVEDGGRSLKEACELLLDERDRLIQLSEAIEGRLEYFQQLDHSTRMLNHPGESLVLQANFLDMVERVDVCIEFLKSHRSFRECDVYLLRFQQCMTRAMTLIRMYFVGSLKALSTDVAKRLSEKDVSDTAQTHLLYTRFSTVSSQVAPLLRELERRAASHPEDLNALLSECHIAYLSTRKSLLVNRLTADIKGLDPSRTELVELTRSGCGYIKQLCEDEFNLYRQFFSTGKEQLYNYLENLCDYLYDDLRPRILHEPRLTSLCEVCTVLQALMVLDVPAGSDSSDEDGMDQERFQSGTGLRGSEGLGSLHITHLLQTVLQDAQTRLFFKAQHVIQSEIRYYVPKAEDLDYPNKLAGAQQPSNGFITKEKEMTSSFFNLPSIEKRDTWYPTLRNTVWVLTQLHDFVPSSIFDEIAQEATNLCRASLVSASDMLASKNPPFTKLDGRLFLIRHLLILKDLIGKLEFSSSINGPIPYDRVTNTLKDILRATSFVPFTFSSAASRNLYEDSKSPSEGIDYSLKSACEEVISDCAETATQVLRNLAHTVGQARSRENLPSRDAVVEADKAFRLSLQQELPRAAIRLRLYLEDSGTIAVLLTHIQDRIVEDYSAFSEAIRSAYELDLVVTLLSINDLRTILSHSSENFT
ncbi:Sec34-domain-containing protein [Rickenella mellea]|uniref:Conserved oligomeric Golgi complex subunit 3 n=1 Tax=Rickenella mellea TaxID=50990 RepID=A0A4Y7QE42_9AGAM|nr:Sec34-domain-containing protein [Rickenella mellea]